MDNIDDKIDAIIKHIDKIDDKESLEYVYMDDIKDNYVNLDEIFKDSFLITRNQDNELVMIDDNQNSEKQTLISFIPEVDLMILDDKSNFHQSILEEMISNNTIIIKIFNRIYYMEDQLKNESYITTEYESLKIMNKGMHTKIIQDNL